MGPKKDVGPSLFFEWVVGTTIESALGPIPKKKPKKLKKREIVKFELTTDDETEEDTVSITYPRTGRSPSPASQASQDSQTIVKKVRFEQAPSKSALKKTVAVSSESEDGGTDSALETESDSASSAQSNSASSSEGSKKPGKKVKTAKSSSDSECEKDSPPHPSCKCKDCIWGRKRLKHVKGNKVVEDSTSEASDSEAELPDTSKKEKAKKSKPKEKEKKKAARESEESATSDIDTSDGSEELESSKKSKAKKADDSKNKKEKPTQDNDDGKNKNGKGKEKHKDKEKDKEDEPKAEVEALKSKKVTESSAKKGNYPEASELSPHARRPNLIEPIRAEVVQTERVIETPEDPAPNAYYDPEHNVIRIYHGPVYGGHTNRGLYPKRDQSQRPLPIGMPHPSQNPYFAGFHDNHPPRPEFQQNPVTQGMPVGNWGVFRPPPQMPPQMPPQHYGGGFGPPGPYAQHGPYEPAWNGNRGAFAMSGASGPPPPSTKDRDVAGQNNIGPGSPQLGEKNPYYPNKSRFSSYGSQQAGSNRNKNRGKKETSAGPKPAYEQPNVDGASVWGPNADNNNSGWNNNEPQNNASSNVWDQPAQTTSWPDNGPAQLDNDSNNNNWNDNSNNNNSGGGVWDAMQSNDVQTGDNVGPQSTPMPGAWENGADRAENSGSAPAWGDPTMAASTGGAVDNAIW